MLDLSTAKRVSMLNRLRDSTLSSRGSRSFFLLRRAGDHVKAALPEALQQQLGQIACISKDLTLQSSGQGRKRLAVISAAIHNLERHDLTLVVDEQILPAEWEAGPSPAGWISAPIQTVTGILRLRLSSEDRDCGRGREGFQRFPRYNFY